MPRCALRLVLLASLAFGCGSAVAPTTGAATGGSVTIGIDATTDASGAVTVLVTAPGCDVTPPAEYPAIVVQTRNATTGEVGEGAVALGSFTAPGQGSAVIPAGTPGSSFLLTVDCNGGALHGTQPFTLMTPVAAPVAGAPAFTG